MPVSALIDAPGSTRRPRSPSMRHALKRLVFGVALGLASPFLLVAWLEKRFGTGDAVFAACSQLLSLVPGAAGVHLRAAFYHGALDRCSWEVHVGFGSIFTHRAATLAAHVSMGAYCVIGHADIGPNVQIASRVSIPSGKRQHCGEAGAPSPASRFERVFVGAGSWIGEGAIVMSNIGMHCVVGAGAVVTRPAPEACLVAGNPAGVVKLLLRADPAAAHDRVATP